MNSKDSTGKQVKSASRELPYPWSQQLAAYRAGRLIPSNELDELAYALCDLENKRVGKPELNDLADTLEVCLPETVRARLLRTPRIAARILQHANAIFAFCDPMILDGVLTVWFDREHLKQRKTKRKDPDVTKRRKILKEWGTKEDLNDPRKLRNLFARFDREGVPIPADKSKSTDWIQLLDDRTEDSKKTATISIFKKDFSRM